MAGFMGLSPLQIVSKVESMPSCPFCRMHTDQGSALQEHMELKHADQMTVSGQVQHSQRKPIGAKKVGNPIIVDGNNVAYFGGEPKIINLKKAHLALKKNGYEPIIYVSDALRHKIDKTIDLIRLINLNQVFEIGNGEDDDISVIEEGHRKKCHIVSNDKYSEYLKDYDFSDWSLKKSIIKFEIKDGQFILMDN